MGEHSKTGVEIAFELTELGMQMRAERYRREHSGATEAEVAECVQAWLLERPGAPDGDAVGRVVPFPRPS